MRQEQPYQVCTARCGGYELCKNRKTVCRLCDADLSPPPASYVHRADIQRSLALDRNNNGATGNSTNGNASSNPVGLANGGNTHNTKHVRLVDGAQLVAGLMVSRLDYLHGALPRYDTSTGHIVGARCEALSRYSYQPACN